jgi:UV DNA damage endonuclease
MSNAEEVHMSIKRIGFCCKWIDRPDQVDGIKPKDDCKKYNTGSTTVAWLNRQTRAAAEEKLWDLMKQNIESTRLLVERVGSLDVNLRMVRLSSDILPVYTESSWSYFWRQSDVKAYAERHFSQVGKIAREKNVRLSFHPGQFTVLASEDDNIVQRSIEEFEYHADMARYMGFGREFQDFKINVHISGRKGPEGVRQAYTKLSPEARNCITIENEENSWGLNDCLTLSDLLPIVLDIHHAWINEGEYIETTDPRVKRVIDSWRGRRPVMHYSVSREDYLAGYPSDQRPPINALIESGINRQKLRAHSDFYHNLASNRWALGFLDNFDVICESKAKNLASFELHRQAKQLGFL